MKTSLIASVITLVIVGAIIAVEAVIESKNLSYVIEGVVFIGGVLALSTLLISLAGSHITKHKQLLWPTFLILSVIYGLLLGVWNIYTLSNDMNINAGVVAYQLLFCIVIGFAVGGVAYVCHKVRT
jgi:hypothetical protein